jgi:hypothetical protein
MRRVRRIVLATLVLAFGAGHALGDDAVPALDAPKQTLTPMTCRTDGGSDLRLPPGYFYDVPAQTKLDDEMRRLQTAETRLTAENASFRKSAAAWSPAWWALAAATATGIVLGWEIHKSI